MYLYQKVGLQASVTSNANLICNIVELYIDHILPVVVQQNNCEEIIDLYIFI